MTPKQFGSFIGGLVLAVLIYGSLLFIFIVSTFSFAGERLTEKENREAFCFFALLLVAGTTMFIIVRRVKTNRKYSAAGISVPLLVVVYGLILTGITYYDNLDYRRPFNKNSWEKNEVKPFKMAKTLVKDKILINRTKQQVIAMLGVSVDSFKNESVNYLFFSTDNSTWELRLYFKNDKVIEAFLYEEGLML